MHHGYECRSNRSCKPGFARLFGGGIYNIGGTLSINNTTVSGNTVSGASGRGGGIASALGGAVTINNSTLSGNSAAIAGGIAGSATLQNSIIANNPGGNCFGTMTSDGYNLSSDTTYNFSGPGDLNNTDPSSGRWGTMVGRHRPFHCLQVARGLTQVTPTAALMATAIY